MTSNARQFAVTELPGNALYRQVTARHGLFLANPNDIYVGRALIRYGEYSELEWRVLDQLMPAGGSAIEVGANIGTHTVPLARKAGAGGRVFAFEPQPVVFQNLCANLALNGLVDVHAFNAGCGGALDEIAFPRIDYAAEGNFGGVSLADLPHADRSGAVRVPIVRLDDACPVEALALLKIDAEGMELAVLEGAAALLARCRPVLYVENDRQEQSKALIAHIRGHDYRIWWHLPPLFNPDNFAGDAGNAYGRTVSVNMICVPRERSVDMRGLAEVQDADEHPIFGSRA